MAKRRHPHSIEPTKAQAALHQRLRDSANRIFALEQDLAAARKPSDDVWIENVSLKSRVSFLEGQVAALHAVMALIASGKAAS